MNLLQKIIIKNFRGFDYLEVDGFNQINILIGENNSGKSSLLEAIFLLVGMSNPILPNNINRLRKLNIGTGDGIKYLFHNLKPYNKPEFEGFFSDASSRNLKFNPIFKTTENETVNQNIGTDNLSIDASTASQIMTGLELEFNIKQKHNQKKTFKNTIDFNAPEPIPNPKNKYKEELKGVFITGSSHESNALTRYSNIVKRKKGDIVLEALQKIDSKIDSIYPLPDGLFFSYKDINELVPINLAGDGVRKVLNIVTTIADAKNSIVLIDEIENGLHFLSHKSLWESIITISNEYNIQLFITSHSIETLKCLKKLLETAEYEDTQEKLSVFTVSHTKKSGIKTYRYSYGGLKDAIETETEIRK